MTWQICKDDLGARRRFIVYPGEERFSAGAGVEAIGLAGLMLELRRPGVQGKPTLK